MELLEGLPLERLDAIGRQCAWRHYEAGQHLVSREAPDRDLHMVVAGQVRVTTYSAGGRETSLRDMGPGSSFGELSALDGAPRSADVVALGPVLVASLPQERFLELLRADWDVNHRVLLRLVHLVRSLTERVLDLSTLSVQQRLCRELLRRLAPGATRIEPAPRHGELAAALSTYREQVTRELSQLVKAGVLARDGTALEVRDAARLQALAGHNDGPSRSQV